MVGSGSVRAIGGLLAGIILVLGLHVSVVSAADECEVEVSPRAGSAGTVFVFSGSGFEPTLLTLHKDDAEAGSHTLNVEDAQPWEVSVRSRPGDEGAWSAELSSDDCSATAVFRVTLSNTDAVAPGGGRSGPGVPLVAVLLLAAAGVAGGLTLGRRLPASGVDNPAQ